MRDLVLFDLAFDYHATKRLAVAAPTRAATRRTARRSALLQAAGIAVSPIDDVAGLPVLRTVAMLANEAADAVLQGIASAGGHRPRDAEGRQLSARAARLGRRDRLRARPRRARQPARALRRRALPRLAADRAALRDRRTLRVAMPRDGRASSAR